MGKRVLLKEAAELCGLSQWELRTGYKSNKYPGMRIGQASSGRILFDIDMLNNRISQLMNENVKEDCANDYGKIRKIV